MSNHSKLKKLAGEHTPSGFPGNTLDETTYNNLIDYLLTNAAFTSGNFRTDSYCYLSNGVKFAVFSSDAEGNPTSFTIYRVFKTKKIPMYDTGVNNSYENAWLKTRNVMWQNNTYAVYDDKGLLIDSSNYSLAGGGVVTFTTNVDYKYITVDELEFEENTRIDITRGSFGEIESFDIVPL